MYTSFLLSHLLILISWFGYRVVAANLAILVGAGASFLSISPQNMTLVPPAVLRFSFEAGNHSIVQGDFETPCQPKANGFNSGFIPVFDDFNGSNPFYEIAITNNEPIFYFSGQGKECQEGMVGVINANLTMLGKYISGAARATNLSPVTTTTSATSSASSLAASSSTSPPPISTTAIPSNAASTADANKTVNISGNALVAGVVLCASVIFLVSVGLWIHWRRNLTKPSRLEEAKSDDGYFSTLQMSDGTETKRLTGLGIQEVDGLEMPYEMDDKRLQEMETRERPQEVSAKQRSIYELESMKWI